MPTKRIVLIGDLHCGHRAGLTPPDWRFRECSNEHVWKKFTRVQAECWRNYMDIARKLRKVDCLVVNGDCIDGRGEKSGGVELITGDRNEQCKMAVDCIDVWNAKEIVLTEGTGYHCGEIESWEHIIAEMLLAKGYAVKIGAHEWIDVNGYVFDVKHHVGSSSVPYGRVTPSGKDEVWNAVWAEAGLQPRANMIVRSHVHYCVGGYRYVGGKKREFMTLPALQAMGTRFGARRCSGTVDWGVVAFDVDTKGHICQRHEYVKTIASTVAKVHRV
jgi:hypothetical protein